VRRAEHLGQAADQALVAAAVEPLYWFGTALYRPRPQAAAAVAAAAMVSRAALLPDQTGKLPRDLTVNTAVTIPQMAVAVAVVAVASMVALGVEAMAEHTVATQAYLMLVDKLAVLETVGVQVPLLQQTPMDESRISTLDIGQEWD